jgi:hypothetical protein
VVCGCSYGFNPVVKLASVLPVQVVAESLRLCFRVARSAAMSSPVSTFPANDVHIYLPLGVRDPRSRKNSPAIATAPIANVGSMPQVSAVRSAVSAGELRNKQTAKKATKIAAAFIIPSLCK